MFAYACLLACLVLQRISLSLEHVHNLDEGVLDVPVLRGVNREERSQKVQHGFDHAFASRCEGHPAWHSNVERIFGGKILKFQFNLKKIGESVGSVSSQLDARDNPMRERLLPTFKPLLGDNTDEQIYRFGPECTLLVGFTREEAAGWREVLDEIGADFMRVTTCVKSMLHAPLGQALETFQEDASAVAPALGVPRMMFLSGMNSMEVMEIVGVYEERGWAPSVFACAVPKNYETPLADLLTEIMDDHERLTGDGA